MSMHPGRVADAMAGLGERGVGLGTHAGMRMDPSLRA